MASKLSVRRKTLKMFMRGYKFKLPHALELPIRIRPWFVGLTAVVLLSLAFLGFTNIAEDWPLNDKVLHFICLGLATAVFYWVVDVDEEVRHILFWRYFGLGFSSVVCIFLGGFVSEIIQSLLPYKTFQWGDVVANILGSTCGLILSYRLEKYYRFRREVARLYQPLGEEESDEESPAELLPTHKKDTQRSSISSNPRKTVRIGNVWDAREDFDIGTLSDSDEEDTRGQPPNNRHSLPQIVVSQSH